jgi:hypothetical protein
MNEAEKRVLHGLYVNRTHSGMSSYDPEEINWLAHTHIPATRNWRRPDGSYHAVADGVVDIHSRSQSMGAVTEASEKPLRHLREAGYIAYAKEGDRFRVDLTSSGEAVARQLDTPSGRRSFWYKSHRGLAWLIVFAIALPIALTLIRYFLFNLRPGG